MATNANGKKLSAAQRRNEMITNRLTVLFLISTIMCVIFITIQNGGSGMMYPFRTYVCPALMIISAVGIVMSILWSFRRKKEGYEASEDFKIIKPAVLIAFFAALFAIALMYYTVFRSNQNYKSIVAVVILTVIAIIYDCFTRDFFWFTVCSAGGAVLMFAHGNAFSFAGLRAIVLSVFQIISILAPIAVFAAAVLTDKNGMLKLGSKKIGFLGRGASKWNFYVLAAVLLALNVVLCFINAGFVAYALIAVFAFYLLYAVIYAVKQLSK